MAHRWRQPFIEGVLTREELEQYWTEGYVVKNDLLEKQQLDSVRTAVASIVDTVAQQLFKAGKITDLCESEDFFTRLTLLEAQFPNASVLVHKQGKLPPEIAALWCSPQLMSAACQLLGEDVGGHPVWNIRCKTPHQEQATVPWHQDNAYLDPESWQMLQVTAWIPLLDATIQNGCMQVLRRGHLTAKTVRHTCCVGGTWYVGMDEAAAVQELGVDLDTDVVTCQVPCGSVLFLNNLIPHRSLNNCTDQIRWSLDLRWQRPHEPNGFYGLKDSIVMAKKGEPNYEIDWTNWAALDRNSMQMGASSTAVPKDLQQDPVEGIHDDLDTTIMGPWMNNWDIVLHNRHVAAHLAAKVGGSEQWTFA